MGTLVESELQLELSSEAQFHLAEPKMDIDRAPLHLNSTDDTIQGRDHPVELSPHLLPAVVSPVAEEEEALEDDEVEIEAENNNNIIPVRRMGRLRRFEAMADDMHMDLAIEDNDLTDPVPVAKPLIKKRLVVKSSDFPEDLLDMEAEREEGEEGEDEDGAGDGYWENEEDEYEKLILAANDGGEESPGNEKKKKKRRASEREEGEGGEGEDEGESGSEGQDEDVMEEGGAVMDEQKRLRSARRAGGRGSGRVSSPRSDP